MFVFSLVVGGLLFGFGGLIMLTAIEPSSWDWDEVKESFLKTFGRVRFWVGMICFFIGFLMLVVPMNAVYNW